jgi:hypothetical protein
MQTPIEVWARPETFAPTHVGAVWGQSPLVWQRNSPFVHVDEQPVVGLRSMVAVGGHVGCTVALGSQQKSPPPPHSEPRVQDQHGKLQFTPHPDW